MAEILSLAGRSALSPFRLSKLLQSLTHVHPAHAVADLQATFRHFVELARPLRADERRTLDDLLTYGDDAVHGDGRTVGSLAGGAASRHHFAVVVQGHRHRAQLRPRRGASASSAACCIRRAHARTAAARSRAIAAALLPLLHDRMTETVLIDVDDAAQLCSRMSAAAA